MPSKHFVGVHFPGIAKWIFSCVLATLEVTKSVGQSVVWFIHPSVRLSIGQCFFEGSKNFLLALPKRTGLKQPCIQPCYFLQKLKKIQKKICQEWDLNPRPHLWTRILMAMHVAKALILESGALDHSAILTC